MPGLFKSIGNFLGGTPSKRENVSTLRPEQEQLYQQLINSGMKPGAGGAFGGSADYYRNLLSDNSADYNAFAAPALRQYNEDIVPGISEQFAGGGGGQGSFSSSGFRNAQLQGATDLAERLGSIRAQLRQQGAQGLQSIGQQGLQNYSQNMETQAGSPGLLGNISQGIGNAIGSFGGDWLKNSLGSGGNKSGNKVGANSPPIASTASPKLPDFSYSRR